VDKHTTKTNQTKIPREMITFSSIFIDNENDWMQTNLDNSWKIQGTKNLGIFDDLTGKS
jgi:hypothetical protein